MPLGPNAEYLVRYNGFVLPGYAQSESFDSLMNIANHYGAYIDGSPSESTGLQNKQINVRMKVWEPNYLACKEQLELAATYLRSTRYFAPLYIHYTDRYYTAITKDIKFEQDATRSKRVLEYEILFEAKPWLESETLYSLTREGDGTITTSGRSYEDGGWTPVTLEVESSSLLTVSGYTDSGLFTGFVATNDEAVDLVVDTEAFTAEKSGPFSNALPIIENKDFGLYLAPGETKFAVNNSSATTIVKWRNRWYI